MPRPCPSAAGARAPDPVRVAVLAALAASLAAAAPHAGAAAPAAPAWPEATRESRPHAYWWWHGSAVDKDNLTRELERYRAAGMGGVHIVPIYQAKGWEDKSIPYLAPRWMEMLRHCLAEGRRLDLDIDMTTGTGWCFGGPEVGPLEANATVIHRAFPLPAAGTLPASPDLAHAQALVAFPATGPPVDLSRRIGPGGTLDWTAPSACTVHLVSQQPSKTRVKRAAPGGEGPMLNLFSAAAMRHYLERFERAFHDPAAPVPRAMYHDSYEYSSNWSPELLAQFERRRGYRLQDRLPALFDPAGDEHAARVKCDYRETLSDLMATETMPLWVDWCHRHGILTRNQAHGSPANLLDLYALADIPETEMFHRDRNPLVCKFASSAAHVAGRRLVAAETGTWLKEHFTETLADMKWLLDDLFVTGVNHVFYHGTCYSPDEAPWPGWLFYASSEINPRNPVWHDLPALNAYVTRCQSTLQHGKPDNDILLYWPVHDLWQNNGPLEQKLTVHAREWLEGQPLGKAARRLWDRGHCFDYCSDRQLASAAAADGMVEVPGGRYTVVVVPACRTMPVATFQKMLDLAAAGATVAFEGGLPQDVPGAGELEQRRTALRRAAGALTFAAAGEGKASQATHGKGRILAGELEAILAGAGVARETMADFPGIRFVRRSSAQGRHYFVANRGESGFDGWLPLACDSKSALVMDPMTGQTGRAALRHPGPGRTELRLQIAPGASLVLRASTAAPTAAPPWPRIVPVGKPSPLAGRWRIEFLAGGPRLPAALATERLAPWHELAGEEASAFAGTARHTIEFAAPGDPAQHWLLDLGQVCQSARVRLNEQDLGTLLVPPFRVPLPPLKPAANRLEITVTSTAANRIRDLDRRKVPWKRFHDINFVNLDYRPFDASRWPVADAGLLGPVTLTPCRTADSDPAPTAR